MERIFCIGFGRTGTSTLCAALDKLGYRALHSTFSPRMISQLWGGNFTLHGFEKWNAFADAPIAPWYRELERQHPRARFILTVRDEMVWVASMAWLFSRGTLGPGALPSVVASRLGLEQMIVRASVYGSWTFDADVMLERYRRHVQAVLDYFSDTGEVGDYEVDEQGELYFRHAAPKSHVLGGKLLVLNICEGGDSRWDPLCQFLGRPDPGAPFPHENRRPR